MLEISMVSFCLLQLSDVGNFHFLFFLVTNDVGNFQGQSLVATNDVGNLHGQFPLVVSDVENFHGHFALFQNGTLEMCFTVSQQRKFKRQAGY